MMSKALAPLRAAWVAKPTPERVPCKAHRIESRPVDSPLEDASHRISMNSHLFYPAMPVEFKEERAGGDLSRFKLTGRGSPDAPDLFDRNRG